MGSKPSKPTTESSQAAHGRRRRPDNNDDGLSDVFANISLNDDRRRIQTTRPTPSTPPQRAPPSFPVPHPAAPSTQSWVEPPSPPPVMRITMPEPQPFGGVSRTMQYARHPILADMSMASLNPPPPARAASWAPSNTLPLPQSTPNEHAASVPPSPPDEDDDPSRCHANTKKGERCKKKANMRDKASIIANAGNPDSMPYLCGMHTNIVLETKQGFHSPRAAEIWRDTNHQDDGYVRFSRMYNRKSHSLQPSTCEQNGYRRTSRPRPR